MVSQSEKAWIKVVVALWTLSLTDLKSFGWECILWNMRIWMFYLVRHGSNPFSQSADNTFLSPWAVKFSVFHLKLTTLSHRLLFRPASGPGTSPEPPTRFCLPPVGRIPSWTAQPYLNDWTTGLRSGCGSARLSVPLRSVLSCEQSEFLMLKCPRRAIRPTERRVWSGRKFLQMNQRTTWALWRVASYTPQHKHTRIHTLLVTARGRPGQSMGVSTMSQNICRSMHPITLL